MRQKLEKKKDTTKPEEEETPSAISSGKSDQPTVEKLLEFIEGPQEEPKLSARAAKRQRRKQRKVRVCMCASVHVCARACACMYYLYVCICTVCDNITLTFRSRFVSFNMNNLTVLQCVVQSERWKEGNGLVRQNGGGTKRLSGPQTIKRW